MQPPSRPAPASFLKHAATVASFYGFRPLREVERRVPGLERRAPSFAPAAHASVQHPVVHPGEPVLAYWASGTPMHAPHLPARETAEFGLNIVGVPEPRAGGAALKAKA